MKMIKFSTLIAVCLMATCFAGEKVILEDDFNRGKDEDKLGNKWTVVGDAFLEGKTLKFDPYDQPNDTIVEQKFTEQKDGTFVLEFDFLWVREFEMSWSFYMQLGHSSKMPKKMDEETSRSEGIVVNTFWGGGDSGSVSEKVAVFGTIKDEKITTLRAINDIDEKSTMLKNPKIRIEVDMAKSVYHVTIDGKTYKDQAFDNSLPIDTVRFLTHNASGGNFNKTSIDNVKISKTK